MQASSQPNLLSIIQGGEAPGPADDAKLQMLLMIITCMLSIIGCFFNLTTTLILKIAHNTLGKMVVVLCIMDLLYNVCCILTDYYPGNSITCMIESSLMIGGFAGSIFWTCCFAHCLYVSAKGDTVIILEDYFTKYTILSIIAAIIFGTTSGLTNFIQYEETTGCVHQTKTNAFDLSFFLVLICPVTLAVLYCIFCYASTIRALRQLREKLYLELLIYPLVLIICFFPYIGVGIYKQINETVSIPSLVTLISKSLFNLQGFLNAFVYGLSRRIIDGYKHQCCNGADPESFSLPHTFNSSSLAVYTSRAQTELEPPRYLKITESF